MMMMMIQGARLHSIVPSTKVCSLVLLLLLLGVLSLFTTTLPRSGSLAACEEEEEEEEKNVDIMCVCVCVCVINVSHTKRERHEKCVFFSFVFFFQKCVSFSPFF